MISELTDILQNHNAINITTIDLKDKYSWVDYLIIATVSSKTQMLSIFQKIELFTISQNTKIVATEGLNDGNWGVIDLGFALIHLFRAEVRDYYNLEEFWQAYILDKHSNT